MKDLIDCVKRQAEEDGRQSMLNAKTLALRLDVSRKTISKWTRAGKIPFVRDGKRGYLYDLGSVMASRESR